MCRVHSVAWGVARVYRRSERVPMVTSPMAANPPGPGLPKQAPSVLMVTSPRVMASPGLGRVCFCAKKAFPALLDRSHPLEYTQGASEPCFGRLWAGKRAHRGGVTPVSGGFRRDRSGSSPRRGVNPEGWGGCWGGFRGYGLGTGDWRVIPFFPRPGAGGGPGLYLPGPWVPAALRSGRGGAGRCAERFPVLLSGAGRPAPGGLASLPRPRAV